MKKSSRKTGAAAWRTSIRNTQGRHRLAHCGSCTEAGEVVRKLRWADGGGETEDKIAGGIESGNLAKPAEVELPRGVGDVTP